MIQKLLLALIGAALAAPAHATTPCQGVLYLTIDTGSMSQADLIAETLKRYGVKATFFLANEKTINGDWSLDPTWGDYWRARVKEGHAFGSHTWRHWYFRADTTQQRIRFVSTQGHSELLDQQTFCAELKRSDDAFFKMTGRRFDPIWRAPGGKVTPLALAWAPTCGYTRHVGWTPAGFLGDELPSEKYPNQQLLAQAIKNIRDGDILVMHTGIWSRRDPFAPMLDPLLKNLTKRGFCFATLA